MNPPIHSQPSSRSSSGIVIRVTAAIVAGLCLSPAAPDQALAAPRPYTFQALTALGDAAPGGGAFNNDFEPYKLNNRGELVFTAEPELPGQEGVFLASSGGIQQIMRFGQPAPGGGVFSTVEQGLLGLNDSGDAALSFQVEASDGTVAGGLYRWSHISQTLSVVVVPNVTPVPGGGVFQGVFFEVSLNNQGSAAFTGFLSGPQGPLVGAFVADRFGNISDIAQPGDPVPGGGIFSQAFLPNINNGGDAAFVGFLTDGSSGVYLRRAASSRIQALPLPAGTTSYFVPRINDRGDVAFFGGGADTSAIFLDTGGSTRTVAAIGQQAPGGGTFNFFALFATGEGYSFNNSSDVAFVAGTDAGDQAVYLYSAALGTTRRLAGIGTVVPGAGVITDLAQFGAPSPNTQMALNDRGQVAFQATAGVWTF